MTVYGQYGHIHGKTIPCRRIQRSERSTFWSEHPSTSIRIGEPRRFWPEPSLITDAISHVSEIPCTGLYYISHRKFINRVISHSVFFCHYQKLPILLPFEPVH